MDTQLVEAVETHSKPLDSVELQQTLGGCPSNLPPFPPTETLDDFELSDPSDSPFQGDDGNNEEEEEDDIDGISLCQLFDIDSPREDGLDDDISLMVSPINTHSGAFTSPWYLGWSDPWPSIPSKSHFLQPWETGSGSVSPVWVDEKRATVGAGLQNLGNTCFLNAVMQCFTHTVPLVQGLLYSDHPIRCDRNNYGFCVLCAFRRHIEVSLASTCRDVSPWNFVDNLHYFSSNFQRYQQEDAHEFLQCFLDRLDSCCIDTKTKDFTLAASNDSFVKQTFGGRLVSKLMCCNCGHFSDTFEPSIDLSLEIEEVTTLQAALESFTKVEKIEDQETKFSCENCNQEVSIEKQLVLDQTPIVTAFHLKRFKNYGSYVEKIDKCVEFPLELDLQPYATNSPDTTVDLKYDLSAFVVHIGFSSTSGHYYCFIRSAPDTWFKFDDSKVVRVSEDYVLSQEAYILFYAKQGTQWCSSYLETLKTFLDSYLFNTSPKSVLDNLDTSTSSSSHVTNQNHDVNETNDAGYEVRTETPNELINEQGGGSKDKVDVQRISTIVPLGISSSICGTFNVEEVCEPSVLQAKSLNQNHDFNETSDAENKVRTETPDELINKQGGGSKDSVDVQRISTVVPLSTSNFLCGTFNVEEVCELSVLQAKSLNQNDVKINADNASHSPPSSPCPDIHKEHSPEVGVTIKCDHLNLGSQLPCKRQLKKKWESHEAKEAHRYLRSMPSTSRLLLVAMESPHSEGSHNKRRRRMEVSPLKDGTPLRARRSVELKSAARCLAAGSFR